MKIVRIRGLKEYTVGEKRYRYHRLSNTPIDPRLSGAALAAEVDRLDRLHKPLAPRAGTLRLLVVDYRTKAQHWARLKPRTRANYEAVFKWLGAALDKPLTGFTPQVIVGLRDKAKRLHGFKFANQVLVTLDMVLQHGVEYGDVGTNPVRDVTRVARPLDLPDANRPWTPLEAVALLDALPIHLRAPVAVAAYLAPRETDVVVMPRSALKDGTLSYTSSKTRRRLDLPVPTDLAAILANYATWRAALFKARKRTDDALTLFVNSRGQPWTIDGFKTSFGKQRDKLVKSKTIAPGVTFHGARHTVATILAEAGFEDAQTKHVLGHGKETMTEHYSRRAKRRALLQSMVDSVERTYRAARGNVIQMDRTENKNV